MQPTSIQLSFSQAKADPSIAWARFPCITHHIPVFPSIPLYSPECPGAVSLLSLNDCICFHVLLNKKLGRDYFFEYKYVNRFIPLLYIYGKVVLKILYYAESKVQND